MAIASRAMSENRDALWELARQQSTTAIHDAGAFLTADNLAELMLTDADQLPKQLADW